MVRYTISVLAATLAFFYLADYARGETINSDPHFAKEGPKAYTCTTPKGRKVKCNKWEFKNKTGWKKKCGLKANKSPFKKLKTRDAKRYDIRTPESGCVALYDREWSDHRLLDELVLEWEPGFNDEEIWLAMEAESYRELKPAEFHQKVEIHEEGTYELRACMAVKQYLAPDIDIFDAGGVSVKLEQWHEHTRGMPTLHANLPNDMKLLRKDAELRPVVFADEFSPERGVPYAALRETGDIYDPTERVGDIWDGEEWVWATDGEYATFWDGHVGHAGLRGMYNTWRVNYDERELYEKTEAIWTCHNKEMTLGPGFYIITAEVNPYFEDNDSFYFYDYDGWGSIRTVELNRVHGVVGR